MCIHALCVHGVCDEPIVRVTAQTSDDISPEMRAFPKWKFALISICDTFAGLLILIPARHVDGDLLTLLIQGTVPATLFFSVVILKKRFALRVFVSIQFVSLTCGPLFDRFHWLHYVGCVIILGGIFLNTYPAIHDDAAGPADSIWYTIPLFLSCIPAALSGICAEIALQGQVGHARASARNPLVCVAMTFPLSFVAALQDMDIYYYQLWVAISQFVLSAILSPLSFILQSPGHAVSELPHNIYEGIMCWCVCVPLLSCFGPVFHLAHTPLCVVGHAFMSAGSQG